MSVLKIIREDELTDAVVAGQIRYCPTLDWTVLVIEAPSIMLSPDDPEAIFSVVILDECGVSNFSLNAQGFAQSADKVAKEFPEVMDAELSVKEVVK